MNRCGCNPVLEPFEFPVEEIFIKHNYKFLKLFPVEKDINELKEKVICEYSDVLNKLECGILLDLESLLEDISYIYIREKLYEEDKTWIPPATYIGFSITENIDEINKSELIKRYLPNISTVENIRNKIYGSYLWIISPYTLDKVATDEGFTFEVKMNLVGYKEENYYYRSNSKIDICDLTYYIK